MTDEEIARKHAYVIESLRGDLYIKYIDFITKNPKVDASSMQDKLVALSDAADYCLHTIDLLNKAKKELQKKELLINKLLAEKNLKP